MANPFDHPFFRNPVPREKPRQGVLGWIFSTVWFLLRLTAFVVVICVLVAAFTIGPLICSGILYPHAVPVDEVAAQQGVPVPEPVPLPAAPAPPKVVVHISTPQPAPVADTTPPVLDELPEPGTDGFEDLHHRYSAPPAKVQTPAPPPPPVIIPTAPAVKSCAQRDETEKAHPGRCEKFPSIRECYCPQ